MRRVVIFGLIGLLIVLVVLDFQTTSDVAVAPVVSPVTSLVQPSSSSATPVKQVPTVTPLSVAAAVTRIIITATPITQASESASRIATVSERTLETRVIITATPLAGQVQPTTDNADDLGVITPVLAPSLFGPTAINGIDYGMFLTLPAGVQQHVRQIFAQGQMLGNNPRAFSKLGDSTIEHPHFMVRFDDGDYNLGDYTYLQPTIHYFAGSFGRQSVAIRRGLHTWSVLDPMWAPKPACFPAENMLACEFRLNRPSVLFIRLGSNDAGVPDSTEESFRDIVQFAIDSGVIPILGTKADRRPSGQVNNDIMRQVAADFQIPLMDYDLVAQTLPGDGLAGDGVHLTAFYAHDYTSATAFERGHSTHNLTALVTLDLLWRVLLEVDS